MSTTELALLRESLMTSSRGRADHVTSYTCTATRSKHWYLLLCLWFTPPLQDFSVLNRVDRVVHMLNNA